MLYSHGTYWPSHVLRTSRCSERRAKLYCSWRVCSRETTVGSECCCSLCYLAWWSLHATTSMFILMTSGMLRYSALR